MIKTKISSVISYVYPTDTCYGLGVDATSLTAVRKLYKIKGRSFKKPVHIVVSSVAMAKQYVKWNGLAEKLAKAFWPGSLTLVLPAKKNNSVTRMLSAGTGFLGVRMPNHEAPLKLVRKLKKPITATSANVSGKPSCYSLEEVKAQFKARKHKPDILIDGGGLRENAPSTVVMLKQDSYEILRDGPITQKMIDKTLRS